MAYSLETLKEIWDDQSGEHIEVGPDRDGLDMIEIRYYDDAGKTAPNERLTFTKEQAVLIIEALQELTGTPRPREEKQARQDGRTFLNLQDASLLQVNFKNFVAVNFRDPGPLGDVTIGFSAHQARLLRDALNHKLGYPNMKG